MKKPLIGLTPLYDLALQSAWMLTDYIDAIEFAGGIPVVLSINNGEAEIKQLVETLDGILFPGGQDIDPILFGEEMLESCGPVVPQLDATEMLLVRAAYEAGVPIAGICRGHQVINVALGGTLYQDIPTQMKREPELLHWQYKRVPKDFPIHRVEVAVDSRLHRCLGVDTLAVNSLHHQAVKDLAPGLKATAVSADGIVECLECEDPNRFVMGIQWHPELMFRRDEASRKILKLFIQEASRAANA